MKFSTRKDITIPIEDTYDILTDFEYLERRVMRRGAELWRTDALGQVGTGMSWEAAFRLRRQPRRLKLEIVALIPNEEIGVTFISGGLHGTFNVHLLGLSRTRTRMQTSVELIPKSLSARLLVQSMKLTKSLVNKRFKIRISEYASIMEERHQERSAQSARIVKKY